MTGRLALLRLICGFAIVSLARAAVDCSKTVNGKFYDLSTLNKQGVLKFLDGGGTSYHFDVCGSLPDPCTHGRRRLQVGAGATNGAVQQWLGDNVQNCYRLANWDASGQWSATANGLQIVFNNGEDCNSVPRQVIIDIKCDESAATATGFTAGNPPNEGCVYNLNLTSKYGCAGAAGPSHGAGGAWDWEKKFLLAFPLILLFYFGIGYGINYQSGKRGTEAVPNAPFWSELPSLVKDGCKFTYSKIKQMRSQATNEPGVPSDDTMEDARAAMLTGDAVEAAVTSEAAGGYGTGAPAAGNYKAPSAPPDEPNDDGIRPEDI